MRHAMTQASGMSAASRRYLYAAEGSSGMRVYDVASTRTRGVSQRLITAPSSPLGQDTHIGSKNATLHRAADDHPSIRPRNSGDKNACGESGAAVPSLYNYAYITDAREGLILADVNTLADGDPRNNYLERALTWHPNGVLDGAGTITIGGTTCTSPRSADRHRQRRQAAANRRSSPKMPLAASGLRHQFRFSRHG